MNAITSRFTTIATLFAGQQLPGLDFWKNLFSWDYWTNPVLADSSPYALFFLLILDVIIFGLLFWRVKLTKLNKKIPVYQPVVAQLISMSFFLFISAVIYLFGRSQELQYISSRLWILGVLLIAAAWFAYILYYVYNIVPAKTRLHLEKERFLRYIPKKKERI